jgi:hypothetical protein
MTNTKWKILKNETIYPMADPDNEIQMVCLGGTGGGLRHRFSCRIVVHSADGLFLVINGMY